MLSRVVMPARARSAAGRGRGLEGAGAAALADAWRALWASRLLVWAAAVVAVLAFGLSGRMHDFDPAGVTTPFGPVGDVLAAPLGRWDSVWYLAIAGAGYGGDAGVRGEQTWERARGTGAGRNDGV